MQTILNVSYVKNNDKLGFIEASFFRMPIDPIDLKVTPGIKNMSRNNFKIIYWENKGIRHEFKIYLQRKFPFYKMLVNYISLYF